MDKLERALLALKKVWVWETYYWHPLQPTTRSDVIAFDCNRLEEVIPEKDFEAFLEHFYKDKKVYVFQETDSDYVVLKLKDFGYWHSEICIAELSLRNIVYWSHEGTVTLGGWKLIESFKSAYPNYQKLVSDLGCKP